VAAATIAACGGGQAQTGAAGQGAGAPEGGAAGAPGGGAAGAPGDGAVALPDVGALPDVPFARPDAAPYVPKAGTCGFDAPAFCDTFESGPSANGGRS